MEGQILGNRYELLERIGGGGMARVYRAKCRLLHRIVAVKILRKDFANDEEFIRRFRIEAQAAASLSHPNIVSIYDVGQEEDVHYIVMEFIDGITLKQVIQEKGPVELKEVVNIGRQMCAAIDHAHKNGIVHRDIKPHNILYNQDGIVKVTDFGIARAAALSSATIVGMTMGSVHYFSPEQARGGYTDEKSDIYSMGIVLYEMATGKLPFDGDTPVAIALQHVQNIPNEPIALNPLITVGLNSVILNAIRKEQSLRYQTAAELLRDLTRLVTEPNVDYRKTENDFISETRRVPVVFGNNDGEDESVVNKGRVKRTPEQKRRRRFAAYLILLVAVTIVPVFAYVGMEWVVPAVFGEKAEVYVFEDYTGNYFVPIKQRLEEKGIEVVEKRTFDDQYPNSTIISQSRRPGEEIKLNRLKSTIELVVSDGPNKITVPDLQLIEYREAIDRLGKIGLKYEMQEVYHETVPTRMVISSTPSQKSVVNPNTTITLMVSKGPEEKWTLVPYLVGKTRTEALKLLSEANLTVGDILPENSTNNEDVVIDQLPKANARIAEGSPIQLTFELKSVDTNIKMESQVIELQNLNNYPEQIRVMVEITPKGERLGTIVKKEVYEKSMFPVTMQIPVPIDKEVKMRIYVEDGLYFER